MLEIGPCLLVETWGSLYSCQASCKSLEPPSSHWTVVLIGHCAKDSRMAGPTPSSRRQFRKDVDILANNERVLIYSVSFNSERDENRHTGCTEFRSGRTHSNSAVASPGLVIEDKFKSVAAFIESYPPATSIGVLASNLSQQNAGIVRHNFNIWTMIISIPYVFL